MSYTIWLSKPLDGTDHEVFDVGSYTSNVSPMWTRALGAPLAEVDGCRAEAVTDRLRQAVQEMLAHPDRFKAMNPDNGWGDYEGARAVLEKLLFGCRLHPEATVRIHR